MSSISVTRFEGTPGEWDDFVRRQPNWTNFHLYGWKTVMERVFRHECLYFAARDARGMLTGVLPLVRVKSLLFGHFLVSMPFLNYGGPLGDEESIQALTRAARDAAVSSRVKLLELRSRAALPIDLAVSHRKLTVLLDLPETSEILWKKLPAKVRSQVRRPQKEGVSVRIGPQELDAFYTVFAHHMRDLGTPVLPRAFFTALRDVFGDEVVFAVAYHQEQPIACGCGFFWGREFEISWASSLRSHNTIAPNMLVYWELMAYVIGRQGNVFNFGRCTRDSGTHRFKMQWGGREEQLWWYQHGPAAAGDDQTSTPDREKGVLALASRAWQRMPIPLATAIGPALVRFIP